MAAHTTSVTLVQEIQHPLKTSVGIAVIYIKINKSKKY